MKAEELKHRITLQLFTTVVNENGFEVETWVDFKTLWSAVTNLHGREYFAAAVVKAENTVKFTIRYTEGIDESMRILFKGKHYNISSIDNIKYANKFIEIKAMEVDNSG
ncbi:phage head closure protein [Clostridium folliculivorans]|uniref:phage head closure protein n=1 Tax=Clostridium folliculivorans TaxID=2886038 RepID=UPI0021C4C3C3|nr:phage head closure protein [Clostridium folliculivorans]GKU31453.1 head-tail adaptor [Clostridium folliculivorans]